jgi:hypothetical protein
MKRIIVYFILFSLFSVLFRNHYTAESPLMVDLPVFPKAKGYGTNTRAAYGGGSTPHIYKVTNLNPSGSGSFRNCVEDCLNKGSRICVFEVSGTIDITSNIVATQPYLTIAGQTAPSPGITVKGAAVHIATHDVLIQHIRIRVGNDPAGPAGSNRDGLVIANSGGGVHHVIADHLSVSWATDENISIWNPTNDVTVSNCITSETLDCSIHDQGCHSKNLIVGYMSVRTSIIKNLIAHSQERHPLLQSSTEVINNVMYNFGRQGTGLAPRDAAANISVIGNSYITGQDTGRSVTFTFNDVSSPDKLYLGDNMLDGVVPSDQWDLTPSEPSGVRASSPPIESPNLTIMNVNDVEDYVLANAGARPADRDAVDIRVVNSVRNGQGRIIDSQDEVGGWPKLTENHRTLNLPANMHDDDDGDGYTNLEEWLHVFKAKVEG